MSQDLCHTWDPPPRGLDFFLMQKQETKGGSGLRTAVAPTLLLV